MKQFRQLCPLVTALVALGWAGERYDLVKVRLTDPKQIQTLEQAGCVVNGPDRDGRFLVEAPYARLAALEQAGFAPELVTADIYEFYRQNAQDARYHSYTEIKDTFLLLARNNPGFVKFETLGRASNDSLLFALLITDNPSLEEDEPAVLYEGAIHGDEKCGTEALFAMAVYLVANYGVDPLVTHLVNTREIWIECPGNPYGHINGVRSNRNGVDCNRDYGYMWGGEGGSPGAFSQPESRVLAELALRHALNQWTSYHGGTYMISTAWSYTPFGTRDSMEIQYLAQQWHNATGYPYGPGYRVMYEIHGASKDYGYGAHGGPGWTVEVCIYKTPPVESLPAIILRERNAMLQELVLVNRGVRGIVTDSLTGQPIRARIKPLPNNFPSFADSIGDYHRYLRPGTWTIQFEANGYRTKTVTGVVVADDTVTHLNVALVPDTSLPIASHRVILCDINDENVVPSTPDAALGLHDGQRSSLGQGGWAVFDFGQLVFNQAGNDFMVYEDDADPEGYSVLVADSWQGPWALVGSDTGTAGFDLARAGINSFRYLKIIDDNSTTSGPTAGFDLDAVEAIVANVAALVYQDKTVLDSPPGGNGNGRLDPGETADLVLSLRNVGRQPALDIRAVLASADPYVVVLDSLGEFGTIAPDSVRANWSNHFQVLAQAQCPPAYPARMTLRLTGTGYQDSLIFTLVVGEFRVTDPIPDGPRQPALYWAYDDIDTGYPAHPEFNWIEIRGQGTRLTLSDDQTVTLSLPTGFGPWRYYGQSFSQIAVCSNGWIAAGTTTNSNYSNVSLPDPNTPLSVALNWDDLYPPVGGGVWYYHDGANHRFIVEYDSVAYYSPQSLSDKFEFILYDTTVITPSQDNQIDVLYQTANGFSSSTVGIQDPTRTIAIDYIGHPAAAGIAPGRAIRYTTAFGTGLDEQQRSCAELTLTAQPSITAAATKVRFNLNRPTLAKLIVYDLTGREVRTLLKEQLPAGEYVVDINRCGKKDCTLPHGVYLVRLQLGQASCSTKIVLK